jgi:hypothetical protein
MREMGFTADKYSWQCDLKTPDQGILYTIFKETIENFVWDA